MKLLELRVQRFRNIEFASLEFQGQNAFLRGLNAQGKTNLLEACGYLTAMRSFRGADNEFLIKKGSPEAMIGYTFDHEIEGEIEVLVKLWKNKKEVEIFGEKQLKISDILGKFPTTTLSSEDIQLLRGSPGERRRFLDLTLSTVNPTYLLSLKNYHKALKERNALLKNGVPSDLFEVYEDLLAKESVVIIRERVKVLEMLSQLCSETLKVLSQGMDSPRLTYESQMRDKSQEEIQEHLRKTRKRDFLLKSTQGGPHRDEIELEITDKTAKWHGSEGQQRALVIALKLAQAEYFYKNTQTLPILLADDILGQLDAERRKRFWDAVPPHSQIISTGTAVENWGLMAGWKLFEVVEGKYREALQPETQSVNQ